MKHWMPLLLIAGLLAFATPVGAQEEEEIDAIPAPTLTSSGRGDVAVAVNKIVLVVGEFEYSDNNFHGAFVNYVDNTVSEVVYIGDQAYVRENNETRWTTGNVGDPVGPFIPVVSEEGATVVRFSTPVTVNGVQTTQYQVRIDPETFPEDSTLTSASIDFFIGVSDNYLHKQQITLRGTDEELGDVELEIPIVYSDFNAAVVIGPPPAELVDEAGVGPTASVIDFMGAQFVPQWMRPVVSRALSSAR